MTETSPVFTKTYHQYLDQIKHIDFISIKDRLGIIIKGNTAIVPLLNQTYHVSPQGITDANGEQPRLDVCIILSRYLLMGPDIQINQIRWVAFRDLKDAGPLTVYWKNEVERKISDHFSDTIAALVPACHWLSGELPEDDFPYDLSQQFQLLPKIPALLLFNQQDDEFPASCALLFDRHVDQYLDAESLAILGSLFAKSLCRLSNSDNLLSKQRKEPS